MSCNPSKVRQKTKHQTHMEKSTLNAAAGLTPSRCLNQLFEKENTGFDLDELEDGEIKTLVRFITAYVLNYQEAIQEVIEKTTVKSLRKIAEKSFTETFCDAITGMAMLVRKQNLCTLQEIDHYTNHRYRRMMQRLNLASQRQEESETIDEGELSLI